MQENKLAQNHNMWGGERTFVSNTANILDNLIFHIHCLLLCFFNLFFFFFFSTE